MGAGHLRVAAELQRRLVARGDAADVVDIVEVLPFRLGPLLRTGYSSMLVHAPWLYDAIYRGFFVPDEHKAYRPDPLVALSSPALLRVIEQHRPDAVVSTFHLCAQITGRLRARGELQVTSAVVVTDLVAHRMWLHPGNDVYVCPHPAVAADAAARTGRPAFAAAPAVAEEFRLELDADARAAERARLRAELDVPTAAPVTLVSAGAWGSGAIADAVDAVHNIRNIQGGTHVTLVLCGRNDNLRRSLESRARGEGAERSLRVLGWRDDLAAVMRAADVLVENAAGQTAMEALAVGLPVLTFRPLPGHGRDGARRMAELGLSSFAADRRELREAIAELVTPNSPRRARQIEAGRALFTSDPVDFLDPAPVAT
jgi:UDP-N-acetylglucosamine:LPS N-acetylglucosamine transferase